MLDPLENVIKGPIYYYLFDWIAVQVKKGKGVPMTSTDLRQYTLVLTKKGVSGEEVVVVTERSVQDLDGSEVDGMIRNVGRLADAWDDALAERYGARRSSDA